LLAYLPPNYAVVAECARRALELDGTSGTAGRSWLAPDWSEVCRVARDHGLAPIAHAGLRRLDLAVPDQARAELRATYLASVVHAEESVWPALRWTVEALAARGVESTLLKGASLAYWTYPEPGLRPMLDLDLLVAAEDVGRARVILLEAGYVERHVDGLHGHHGQPLAPPGSALEVELHLGLLPEPNPFSLDLAEIRSRTVDVEVGEASARLLAPEDELLLACLHLTHTHLFTRLPLRSLVDVLAIIAAAECRLDWDYVVATARAAGATGAAYWPLLMARAWLGADVPMYVLRRLAPPWPVRKVVSAVISPGYLLGGQPPAQNNARLLHAAVLRWSLHTGLRPRKQAEVLLAGLFPPAEVVRHLPPSVTRSRLRYTAFLGSPARLGRGASAVGQLLLRAWQTEL
jgi:hypothetical protein